MVTNFIDMYEWYQCENYNRRRPPVTDTLMYDAKDKYLWNLLIFLHKQRVLTPGHQGWNDLHSLCRIGMEYYLLNDNNNDDDDDDDDEW